MKIITLTLSPAFDMHCHADKLILDHENLVYMDLCQAGGKGVNISRALVHNGTPNRALLVLGQENADSFMRNLDIDGVTYEAITVPGRIRENITIHTGSAETRISFPGFRVEPDVLHQVEQKLLTLVDDETIVTMTGRVAEGMAVADVAAMLHKAAAKGAKIVIDSRSFSLEDLKKLNPWLIKPNQEEISAYLGRRVDSLEETLQEATALQQAGITNVMISMGGEGALLVCEEGTYIAVPPEVPVQSTIGAGDSAIAGFIACPEENAQQRLAWAVAYGTAACMAEGTLPPEPTDIQSVFSRIQLKKL